MCRRPAHEDSITSLSVSKRKGQLHFRRHAGCSQQAVREAIEACGLFPRQGYGSVTLHEYRQPELGAPDRIWRHLARHQVHGALARWDTANGTQSWPLIPSGACWMAGGRRKPTSLFNLPALSASPDAPILVWAGEKAADAAGMVFPDVVATTPAHRVRATIYGRLTGGRRTRCDRVARCRRRWPRLRTLRRHPCAPGRGRDRARRDAVQRVA